MKALSKLLIAAGLVLAFSPLAYAKSTVANLPPEKIGFTGKLDNYSPPLFLNPDDFTELKNLRYFANGVGTRSGMTDWCTPASSGVSNLRKIFTFDAANDGLHILAATTNDAGTGVTLWEVSEGTYDTGDSLYQTSATTAYPITTAIVRDSLLVGDETGVSIWSGNTVTPLTLLVEDGGGDITDHSDWIHSGESEHVTSGSIWHVGYSRPFDAVQADTNESMDDGFTSSVSPQLKGGFWRYWATCTATSGGSFFQSPKIETSFRPLTSSWDGTWQYAAGAFIEKDASAEVEDYSLLVADSSEETYLEAGEWESGGTIVFLFSDRPGAVRLRVVERFKNTTPAHASFYKWDGDSWETISGTTVDGTSGPGTSGSTVFAQTGILTIPKQTDWEPRTYGESEFSGYPLLLKTSATVDDYVRIYSVLSIPEADDPNDDGYRIVAGHEGRAWLFDGDDQNLVLVSAYNQPDVFAGEDALGKSSQFRIGKKEKTIAAVSTKAGLIVFKKTDTFLVSGYNPITFAAGVQLLPDVASCVAPESIQLIEGDEGQFLIYQARDGFYALDPSGNNPPASRDIQSYFVKGNALEIEEDWLSRTRSMYDRKEGEYRAFVAAGSGATQFTEQLVFDLDAGKWTVFEVNDNVSLSCGAAISGDEYLRLGGSYSGTIYELERGEDDAGYDIISDFTRPPYILRGGVGRDEIRGRSAVGRQELRALAFDYKLPDDAVITGCSLYMTSGVASTDSTYQEGFNLTTDGWRSSALDPDWEKKGSYHTLRFRVPGRIEFYRQIMWSREAPWELSLNLDLLIDESGNVLQAETDHLLRGG